MFVDRGLGNRAVKEMTRGVMSDEASYIYITIQLSA